jgi:hypothetical protein
MRAPGGMLHHAAHAAADQDGVPLGNSPANLKGQLCE